jgi:hypothetical protein
VTESPTREVMREYARQRKLRRRVLAMPVRTGRAWRLFLGVLTPTHGRVAGTMLDSLRNETVVSDPAAREAFAVKPRGLPEAIERALTSEDHEFADTSWRDVLNEAPSSRWGHPDKAPNGDFTRTARSGTPASGVRSDPADRRPNRLVWR